jgi:hypothetical protein
MDWPLVSRDVGEWNVKPEIISTEKEEDYWNATKSIQQVTLKRSYQGVTL